MDTVSTCADETHFDGKAENDPLLTFYSKEGTSQIHVCVYEYETFTTELKIHAVFIGFIVHIDEIKAYFNPGITGVFLHCFACVCVLPAGLCVCVWLMQADRWLSHTQADQMACVLPSRRQASCDYGFR